MNPIEPEFKPYGKTPRWSGLAVTVTEKIDGTNALVHVTDDGRVLAGSRNRWLSVGKTTDNYGFAAWCAENEAELVKLGPGYHYGEWWGRGIGRNYDLETRTLSLFNVLRWGDHNPNTPSCCSVVPVLYTGQLTAGEVAMAAGTLRVNGSVAAPGYMRPEGVCLHLHNPSQTFKVVFDKTGPSPIEGVK